MLKKKYVKSRNIYKVTFELPKEELPEDVVVENVHLVGEFNKWDAAATPMSYSKNKKAYHALVELEPETAYEFRYVINGDHWYNEWHADDYTPNYIDGDNCVVLTSAGDEADLRNGTE